MDALKNIFHSKNLTIPLPPHSPTFNYLWRLPLSSPPTTFFTSTLMNHHRISGKSSPPCPRRSGEALPVIPVFNALVRAASSHWTTTTSSMTRTETTWPLILPVRRPEKESTKMSNFAFFAKHNVRVKAPNPLSIEFKEDCRKGIHDGG